MRMLPFFKTQKEAGVSSWEGLSLVCQGVLHGQRGKVVEALNKIDVDCKPIYTHVLKNTVTEHLNVIFKDTPVADNVYYNGLYIDNMDHDYEDKIDKIYDVLKELEMNLTKE